MLIDPLQDASDLLERLEASQHAREVITDTQSGQSLFSAEELFDDPRLFQGMVEVYGSIHDAGKAYIDSLADSIKEASRTIQHTHVKQATMSF